MKNAAIYARVSSAQLKEEHTIASQTAALIALDSGDSSWARTTAHPDTALRIFNNVGVRNKIRFRNSSSRPASSLCTLRTCQSPGAPLPFG